MDVTWHNAHNSITVLNRDTMLERCQHNAYQKETFLQQRHGAGQTPHCKQCSQCTMLFVAIHCAFFNQLHHQDMQSQHFSIKLSWVCQKQGLKLCDSASSAGRRICELLGRCCGCTQSGVCSADAQVSGGSQFARYHQAGAVRAAA